MKITVILLIVLVAVMCIFISNLATLTIGVLWSLDFFKPRSAGSRTVKFQNLEIQVLQVLQILFHVTGVIQHVGLVVSCQAEINITSYLKEYDSYHLSHILRVLVETFVFISTRS